MAEVSLQEIWALVEKNRAKPRRMIRVTLDVSVPADATDAEIAEYLRYDLWGGMLRANHPLFGIPVQARDASTIRFEEIDETLQAVRAEQGTDQANRVDS